MRVLVACEYSGIVRDAFLAKGHDAWSCDLLPSETETNRHVRTDCMKIIEWGDWDLVIMHPPCTALAVSGNRWYGTGMEKNQDRIEAIGWTTKLWEVATQRYEKVCMENPVGVLPFKPTQYIQPWMFGHGETKKTGLWLHGLPKLEPTNVVEGREQRIWKMSPGPDRGKERSRFYTGIAEAMADQWGNL